MAGKTGPARKKILDFTNVKEQGQFNPRQVSEGPHRAKVTAVEEGVSKADNEQWVFSIVLPEFPSATYPYYCALNADALWKIRNLFVACGVEIPKKKLNVDPNKLIGKSFIAEMVDDEYEGRMKSKIASVMSLEDYKKFQDDNDEEDETPKKKRQVVEDDDDDDEDEEIEEPAPKKKKKKAKPVVDDDDDDDEIEV